MVSRDQVHNNRVFVSGRRRVERYVNDEEQAAGACPATVAETSPFRTAASPNVIPSLGRRSVSNATNIVRGYVARRLGLGAASETVVCGCGDRVVFAKANDSAPPSGAGRDTKAQ